MDCQCSRGLRKFSDLGMNLMWFENIFYFSRHDVHTLTKKASQVVARHSKKGHDTGRGRVLTHTGVERKKRVVSKRHAGHDSRESLAKAVLFLWSPPRGRF